MKISFRSSRESGPTVNTQPHKKKAEANSHNKHFYFQLHWTLHRSCSTTLCNPAYWWWIGFESGARTVVTRAAIFIVEVFKMRERYRAQLKNEIMNGNHRDHVTFVWTWRRSKPRLRSCRTFHPFSQHNATMPMSCTDVHSEAPPMSHFLNRWVGMSCEALDFWSWANYVSKRPGMHACLQNVLRVTFKAPAPWKT